MKIKHPMIKENVNSFPKSFPQTIPEFLTTKLKIKIYKTCLDPVKGDKWIIDGQTLAPVLRDFNQH